MATPTGPTVFSGTRMFVTTLLVFVLMTETESENSFATYAKKRLRFSSEAFWAGECATPRSRIANVSSVVGRGKKPLAGKQKCFIGPLSCSYFRAAQL